MKIKIMSWTKDQNRAAGTRPAETEIEFMGYEVAHFIKAAERLAGALERIADAIERVEEEVQDV